MKQLILFLFAMQITACAQNTNTINFELVEDYTEYSNNDNKIDNPTHPLAKYSDDILVTG